MPPLDPIILRVFPNVISLLPDTLILASNVDMPVALKIETVEMPVTFKFVGFKVPVTESKVRLLPVFAAT